MISCGEQVGEFLGGERHTLSGFVPSFEAKVAKGGGQVRVGAVACFNVTEEQVEHGAALDGQSEHLCRRR